MGFPVLPTMTLSSIGILLTSPIRQIRQLKIDTLHSKIGKLCRRIQALQKEPETDSRNAKIFRLEKQRGSIKKKLVELIELCTRLVRKVHGIILNLSLDPKSLEQSSTTNTAGPVNVS